MPIEIRDLRYTYSPKTPFARVALDGIDLEIRDGDYIGIIGHTGSGKSTFLQHLNGLIKVQQGFVKVNDIVLDKKYDYKKLRSTVGMVFQYPEYQLFAQSVEKDVGFGPANLKLDKEEIARRVKSALAAVGLDYESIADKSPFEISGGQKRRVALAGVIAMQPSVLVLDEPTAGLDPVGKREVLALVDAIKRETAHTVVMISHNMDEVAEHCSRIVVFDHGKVKFDLPPSELFLHRTELTEMGLDVPKTVGIRDALIERGWEIPRDVYLRRDLEDAIVAAKRAGATRNKTEQSAGIDNDALRPSSVSAESQNLYGHDCQTQPDAESNGAIKEETEEVGDGDPQKEARR